MTNWRTVFKSDHLASWDLDSNVTLTIDYCEVKEVQLQKKEKKVIAHFIEKNFQSGEVIKPMILNATNCKILNTHTGTKEVEQWKKISVEIGVVANKGRIGEANGLSILKVNNSVFVDRLPELEELFLKTKDSITEEEKEGIEKTISDKKQNLYDKCILFLTSKLPKDDSA